MTRCVPCAPRAPPSKQSSRHILAAPCTRTRPASCATPALSAAVARIIHCHLFRRSCARAARCVCRLRRRGSLARAPPGLGASVAGLRHCAQDSAQCRLAPAPAPAPTCARGAACSARMVLAASLCCTAARPPASWAGYLPTGPYRHIRWGKLVRKEQVECIWPPLLILFAAQSPYWGEPAARTRRRVRQAPRAPNS